ncbi:MAG: HlyD family secretion protein [Candidatus Tectomicrobia bacterium]|nr:HlyD family secretion protein [Candidatus Tectomicrobia bacterium]
MEEAKGVSEEVEARGDLKAKLMRKRVILPSIALVLGLSVGGKYAVDWWITAMNTVSTDDARIKSSIATISAEISGKILKLHFDEGDAVKTGDLLIQIDKDDYKAALDESVAELNGATAQYEEGKIQLKAMEVRVRGEMARAEAVVESSRGTLRENERKLELAKFTSITQIDQSEAALKVAESNLASAEVELRNAKGDLDRVKDLFDKKLESAKKLDDAKTAYERAQATVETRKNQVEQSKADLRMSQTSKSVEFRDDAKLAEIKVATARGDLKKAEADVELAKARLVDLEAFKARLETQAAKIEQLKLKVETNRRKLENTDVRSPVNGVVVLKTADLGDVVQRGQSLVRLIIEDTLKVQANIKETYLRYIQRGNPVDIYVDAYPDRIFRGKVSEIGDAANSEFALFRPTGTFTKVEQVIPVEITLDGNSNNRELRPGMNVVVYIKRTTEANGKNSMRTSSAQ